MSFKLSQDETATRDALIDKINAAKADLDVAVEAFNTSLAIGKMPVTAAVEAYNAVLSEVREFAGEIAAGASGDIEQKTEKWQESDKGLAAAEWQQEWEAVAELDDIEVEMPELLDLDIDDHAQDLESVNMEMVVPE